MSQNINKNTNQQPQGKNPSTGGVGGASNMDKTTPRAPAGSDKHHQSQNPNLGNKDSNQKQR